MAIYWAVKIKFVKQLNGFFVQSGWEPDAVELLKTMHNIEAMEVAANNNKNPSHARA